MTGTTIGVKVDDELKARLKAAAQVVGRTPHWLVKQALISAVEHIEQNGQLAGDAPDGLEDDENPSRTQELPHPFLDFAQSVQPQSVLRAQVTAAYRRPEPDCLPLLLSEASLPDLPRDAASELARNLIVTLREKIEGWGKQCRGIDSGVLALQP